VNDVYTPKQLALMRLWQHNQLKRINLLEGSVRSGKTWISLVLWAFWVATMPRDGFYLMVAKTLTSLRRNTLDMLTELVGSAQFQYSISKKEGRLFGRLIHLEGVNDARAESKIRGMTLQGAYCDELTLFTEDFFAMLLSRLSQPGAKLFATTNPDNPNHWLMKKYIERAEELDMLVEKFLIEDNTFLDPEYVDNLKREYTGVFYDRFILGRWVAAEGMVYPMFDEKVHVVPTVDRDYTRFYISCDYGTVNPMAMGLWGLCDGVWYMVREYYFDSRKNQRQKTDEEYYTDLEGLAGDLHIERVIVDPSAASFIQCIRRHGKLHVLPADNDVINGIRRVSECLQERKLLFNDCCKATIDEFYSYVWDVKATEDKPVKAHDHMHDSTRYFVNTVVCKPQPRYITVDF
jgi:PBSX family phage terminase large subunit